ncbi:hypothetical protein LINPERPRIM_LOCUS9885 [Linum perenne]
MAEDENGTCFYRALRDALDARARIATDTNGEPFRATFSVSKLIEREENWLTDRSNRVEDCLKYFVDKGYALSTYPENSLVNFRILDYEVLDITPENAQLVRDEVRENGLVVGRHRICRDYLKPGVVYRTNNSAPSIDDKEYSPPKEIADLMEQTPPSKGIVLS